MDSPWTTFAAADAKREYVALLSYLPLNKYRAIPAFFRYSVQIRKQLRGTPGAIGYSLRAKVMSRSFWTLSVWEDQKTLMEFVARCPHGDAMKAMTPHMGQPKFTYWKVTGSALPLRRDEAIERSHEEPKHE